MVGDEITKTSLMKAKTKKIVGAGLLAALGVIGLVIYRRMSEQQGVVFFQPQIHSKDLFSEDPRLAQRTFR